MRAVVTRVKNARVEIDGKVNGKTDGGFLVLLGVAVEDTEKECDHLADKVCGLRVFEDENGKMNLNLEQVGGSLLVISQFTLFADCKSRRPGFTGAARPPSPSTSGLWPSVSSGASMWNTGSLGRICRSFPRMTAR